MKIRHGFVSNSSSSSFVIDFSKTPKNYKDVIDELNIEDVEYRKFDYRSGKFEDDFTIIPKETIAIYIFNDMRKFLDDINLLNFYDSVFYYTGEEYPFLVRPCTEVFNEFKKEKENSYIVSYGDDGGINNPFMEMYLCNLKNEKIECVESR